MKFNEYYITEGNKAKKYFDQAIKRAESSGKEHNIDKLKEISEILSNGDYQPQTINLFADLLNAMVYDETER